MNLEKLNLLVKEYNIVVSGVSKHSKASELYVEVLFVDYHSKWHIPYQYRRTGLFIDSEEELANYLISVKPFFKKEHIAIWIDEQKQYWENELSGREVTKPFFDELIRIDWISKFPTNPNPQRRLQDIKELGYTIASRNTGKGIQREYLLLPLPRGLSTGYENFSQIFRKKAINVLNNINVYELSEANKAGLIPDHKFPEIRWDNETKSDNPDSMSDFEIKNKFQLIDNQRNQQKREACRNCFQSGKRPTIFGVKYYYEGDEKWETNFFQKNLSVAKIGKNAELGCVGCGWYDIEKWRTSLNIFIENTKVKT